MSSNDNTSAEGADSAFMQMVNAELRRQLYGGSNAFDSATPELIQGSGLSSGAAPSTAEDTPQDFGQGRYSPLVFDDEYMGLSGNGEGPAGADIGNFEQTSQSVLGGPVGALGTIDQAFPNVGGSVGATPGTSEQNSQFINWEGSVGAVGTLDQAPLNMGGPVSATTGTFEQTPGMGSGDIFDLSAHGQEFVPNMGTAGSSTGFQAPAPGASINPTPFSLDYQGDVTSAAGSNIGFQAPPPGAYVNPAHLSQDYQGDVMLGAGSTVGYQAPPPGASVNPAQLSLDYEGNGMGTVGMPPFGQEMPPADYATAPVAPNGIQQPAIAGADGVNMFNNMLTPSNGGAVQPALLPGYQQYPVADAAGNITNAPAPQEMPAAQSRAVIQRLVARRARRANRAQPAQGQSTEGEPTAQRPANRVGQQSGWPQARKHHIRNCADVTACNADCLLKEKFPVTHAKWMSSQFQVQVAGEEAPRSISGMELLSRKGEEGLKCFGEVQPDGSINTHSKEPKRDPSEALQ